MSLKKNLTAIRKLRSHTIYGEKGDTLWTAH
jgi:hypothetical protein